jgi:CheY-like chemotaxis protein
MSANQEQPSSCGQVAPAAHPADTPRDGSEGRRALRILLAEDNPINQRLAVCLLQKQGHAVIVAGNGREALEALAKEAFDVVLMDVGMPVLDGLQATMAIREKEKGTQGHVPIIALTAYALRRDKERCLAAGMDGYLSKPFRSADLFEAVNALAVAANGVGKR